MYTYFVSYKAVRDNRELYFGSTDVHIESPISGMDVILHIEDMIKERVPSFREVTVLCWRKFE